MKKTEGYIVKRLEDEYLVLPTGKRTEEVNEGIKEFFCKKDVYFWWILRKKAVNLKQKGRSGSIPSHNEERKR